MAASLQITDGTTTVTLNSTNMKLLNYAPQSSSSDVTETAEVFFMTGSSYERSDIQSINRLFERARQFQLLRIGSMVFVEYKPSSSDAAFYRSEVKDGNIVIGHAQRASIIWTRVPFWEGPETQIPLTNGNGTNNTSGLTVYNHDDAGTGHDNYVSIAAAAVIGDLPAPPRIEITNSYNNATRAANVYISHNVNSDPDVFNNYQEAETGTGGTTTADSGSSGGYYKAISWATTAETELWDLGLGPYGVLNPCSGSYVRLLMRLSSSLAVSDLWLKVKYKMELTTLWESEWMLAPNGKSLIELGTMQMPPYMAGATYYYPGNLVLCGRRNAAGTHYLNVDSLQLSTLDGWRKLQPMGYNLGYEARLVDDMLDGYLYTDTWALAGKFGNYYTASAPIMLIPNKVQRLYILHDTDGGGSAIVRTFSIKVYYRPRRSSL